MDDGGGMNHVLKILSAEKYELVRIHVRRFIFTDFRRPHHPIILGFPNRRSKPAENPGYQRSLTVNPARLSGAPPRLNPNAEAVREHRAAMPPACRKEKEKGSVNSNVPLTAMYLLGMVRVWRGSCDLNMEVRFTM